MDELFWEAAEHYPLRIDDGDWDSVSGKVLNQTAPGFVGKEKRRKATGRYLLLLILLLLVISGGIFFWQPFTGNDITRRNNLNLSTSGKQPAKSATSNTSIDAAKRSKNEINERAIRVNKKNGHSATENSQRTTVLLSSIGAKKFPGEREVENPGDNIFNPELAALPGIRLAGNSGSTPRQILRDSLKALPGISSLSPMTVNNLSSEAKKNNPSAKPKKGFYIELIGGPDFSEVKSQKITKTGYSVGVLLGYQFNRTLSIESGAIWSSKRYYSAGKYFSMNKVGTTMPAGMEIMEVESHSTLFEFPVKLKCDFFTKERSNFFFTAGTSTTVYVKEKNNYLTKLNGVQDQHVGLYDNLPSSWFSLINISAGYQHVLGKTSSIRIEPYIKIPLKKEGMGSMPVFSTGISIAVSNFLRSQ